jgi:hypothetical protein
LAPSKPEGLSLGLLDLFMMVSDCTDNLDSIIAISTHVYFCNLDNNFGRLFLYRRHLPSQLDQLDVCSKPLSLLHFDLRKAPHTLDYCEKPDLRL